MFKLRKWSEVVDYDIDFDSPHVFFKWVDIDIAASVETLRRKIPPNQSKYYKITLTEPGDIARILRQKKEAADLASAAAQRAAEEAERKQIKLNF